MQNKPASSFRFLIPQGFGVFHWIFFVGGFLIPRSGRENTWSYLGSMYLLMIYGIYFLVVWWMVRVWLSNGWYVKK